MKLSINLCGRARPNLLGETIEKTLANITLPDTKFMISIDHDDDAMHEVAKRYVANCVVSVKRREDTLGEKYNRVLSVAPADVYMCMVDYAPVMIKGFDAIILEAASIYPDGVCAVTGPLANLSFPCFQAVTAKLAEAMGGIYPAYFPYWFVDHWLDDLYKMIDRQVNVPVHTDFWSRRPPKTHELRDVAFWASFYDAAYSLRRDIALKIIDGIDETPARKRALPRNFEMIRQRSCMINEMCRQNHASMETERGGTSPDDRYLRIKANAERILPTLIETKRAA